jgi:hypothetical protein
VQVLIINLSNNHLYDTFVIAFPLLRSGGTDAAVPNPFRFFVAFFILYPDF